jgi:phosphotransferase system HPr (HPr) family protein
VVDRTLTAGIALHARPASLLAQDIARLDASVTVKRGEREANAKGALSLLALDIEAGDVVSVAAEGLEAVAALDVVTDHLTAVRES